MYDKGSVSSFEVSNSKPFPKVVRVWKKVEVLDTSKSNNKNTGIG